MLGRRRLPRQDPMTAVDTLTAARPGRAAAQGRGAGSCVRVRLLRGRRHAAGRAGRHLVSLVDRRLAGALQVRLRASSHSTDWNPVTDVFGGRGPDRRHPGHLGPGAGHRPADRLRRRGLPGRVLPAVAAPADRRRRSSCWPAFPRSSTACGACSSSRPFFAMHVQLPLMTLAPPGSIWEKLTAGRAQRRRTSSPPRSSWRS